MFNKIIELNKNEIVFVSGGKLPPLSSIPLSTFLIGIGSMLFLAAILDIRDTRKKFNKEKMIIEEKGCKYYFEYLTKMGGDNLAFREEQELAYKKRVYYTLCSKK